MKTLRKMLVIGLCLCLVLSCASVSAFAAGEEVIALTDLVDDPNAGILPAASEPTGSITIQNPSHSDATVVGKKFVIYKIFDAATSGSGTSYTWHGDNKPFYDFFYGAAGKVEVNKTNGTVQGAVDYIAKIFNEGGNYALSQLAEDLYNYIITNNVVTEIKTVEVTDSNATSVTIDELGYGYYLIYDNTTIGEGTSAVRSAVMLSSVTPNATIELKANRPHISKFVQENDGEFGKGTSCRIGEVVTFKIETHIPSHTLYDNYTFYIEDTMHDGLTLQEDTIKVYKNGSTTPLVDGTDYNLTVYDSGDVDFKIDFTGLTKTKYAVNDEIDIIYNGVVTNTIVAQGPTPNTATLTYSNDPTQNTTGNVSDTANIYSYQFVFTKFAEDTSGVFKNVRLTGAEFQLYDENNNLINFTKQIATNAESVTFTKYIVAAEASSETVNTLKVHEDGAETINLGSLNYGGHRGDVFIFGLKEGKYKLVETKAPDGYVVPEEPFYIEIKDEIGVLGSVGTLSVIGTHSGTTGKIVNTNGMAENILTVWADITNKPGSALPNTGGMGTTLFILSGIILMAGAAAFMFTRKRNNQAE